MGLALIVHEKVLGFDIDSETELYLDWYGFEKPIWNRAFTTQELYPEIKKNILKYLAKLSEF